MVISVLLAATLLIVALFLFGVLDLSDLSSWVMKAFARKAGGIFSIG